MLSVGYCIKSRVVNLIKQHLPVFSSFSRYFPVNTTGMETHIYRHFETLENTNEPQRQAPRL